MLGVGNGQSYSAFCQAVKTMRLATRCYGIDTWQDDAHSGEANEKTYEELNDYNLREYREFSQLLRMNVTDALTRFNDGCIDLLIIDSSHRYEDVKNEFLSWRPKMSSSGVMVFHDTFIRDDGFEVWKLWEEISQTYPSFEFVHGCGLGAAAVGDKVAEDFIEFLREANSDRFISKLFNSLGQRLLAEARMNQVKAEFEDFKSRISSSSELKYGSLVLKCIDSFAPKNTLRRRLVHRTRVRSLDAKKSDVAAGGNGNLDFSIPADRHQYYMTTLKTLETMPLPPKTAAKKKCAIFVMVKNENVFLPIWLKYYSRYIDGADIYVFDHRSTNGSVQKCLDDFTFNTVRLDYPFSFDHIWFKYVAVNVQKRLLDHYEYVIFTDVDEIIIADVNKYKGLDDYIQKLDNSFVRCIGYDLIHVPLREEPYNASGSVLSQRMFMYRTEWYNKTLIARQPLNWDVGFHTVDNLHLNLDTDLMLMHIHKLDFDLCWKTSFERARLKWPVDDIIHNRGWQNRFTDIDLFREYYEGWPEGYKIEEIPEDLKKSDIF